MTASQPLPTHHHGDGRRCEWHAEFGCWTFDGALECTRQGHPARNAKVLPCPTLTEAELEMLYRAVGCRSDTPERVQRVFRSLFLKHARDLRGAQ